MAGDWIKMRSDLLTHPKIVRMSSALNADKLRVIGGLHAVWCLFDMHSTDGNLQGYNSKTLDDHLGWQGFAAAMIKVEWLAESDESLTTPRFEEHNGQSAKRRATETQRKREARNVREMSASEADKMRSREEKRREDIKEPPNPQGGADQVTEKPKRVRKDRIQLKTFIERCTAAGEKPISEYSPLMTYCEETGLPMEFVSIAWDQFKREFLTGHNSARLQADWRRHFLNYVTKGYYRLWYAKPGVGDSPPTFELSTTGLQAKAQFSRGSQ